MLSAPGLGISRAVSDYKRVFWGRRRLYMGFEGRRCLEWQLQGLSGFDGFRVLDRGARVNLGTN